MNARPPRILCIIETVGRGGGAEQLVSDLVPRLRARGLDVEVAALFDWDDDLGTDLVAGGVPLHRLHLPPRGGLVRGLPRLAALVRRGGFDLFWSHLAVDHLYARVAAAMVPGSATINTFHGELPDPLPMSLRARAGRRLQRWACDGSVARVAVSHATARDIARVHGWRDVQVSHNGVDLARVDRLARAQSRGAARRAFGVADDAWLVVVPARYVAKKGHRHLFAAAAMLRDQGSPIRVLTFGSGAQEAALRALATRLGLEDTVTIGPTIAHEQLFPLLRAADAVVQPSLREPFGIGAVEAMALGTPVILSDVDGFRETTDHGRVATMVPPGDADALAAALAMVRAAPEAAHARAAAARAHVAAHFSIDACAARWHAILSTAADGS